MRPVRFLERARADIHDIGRYIEERSGSREAAARFLGELVAKCHALAGTRSMIGRPRPELGEGIRSYPFERYVIFLRYRGETLVVIRILSAYHDIGAFRAQGGEGGDDA